MSLVLTLCEGAQGGNFSESIDGSCRCFYHSRRRLYVFSLKPPFTRSFFVTSFKKISVSGIEFISCPHNIFKNLNNISNYSEISL